MSDLNLHIHTQEGNTYPVQVAPDTKVDELFEDIIDHLHLPTIDVAGNPIEWRMHDKRIARNLQKGMTVEACGVQEGDHLYLDRDLVAASPFPQGARNG